jgi:hypothetical protein
VKHIVVLGVIELKALFLGDLLDLPPDPLDLVAERACSFDMGRPPL